MSKKKNRTKHAKNATKLPRSVKRLFPQVTQAFDSTEYAEVVVQDKDCKEGKKKDFNECAMARAIKREYKADGVIIGMTASYIIKGNKATRFRTPESVRREIISFDRHHNFEPGEYTLTPPSPTSKLGSEHVYHGRSGSHKPKRRIHKTVGVRILDTGSSY